MGVVYETALPDGSAVALKVLHAPLLANEYAVRKFRDEGIAGAVVNHPNVVSVLDRGETADGVPYLVMTRIRGESLASRLRRDGTLSPYRAAMIVRQILAGLDALHAAGFIHGDVKTSNILVMTGTDGSDTAVLIDLGLASPWPASDPAAGSEDMTISGTLEYMAPELIGGIKPAPAADAYGAGVVLYELLTGTIPWSGATPAEVTLRHLSDDIVPPSLLDPASTIPPDLDQIVTRALDKDPERRFASAAAFATALEVVQPHLDRTGHHASSSIQHSRNTPTYAWAGPALRAAAH